MERRSNSWPAWASGILILIVGSLIWTLCLLSSENVLFNDPNWVSYKSFIPDSARDFEPALNRGVYASGRFTAFHSLGKFRIFSKFKTDPKSIETNFRVREDGYLDVIFNITDHGFTGVRLSRHPFFPNIIYESDLDGKFERTEELPKLDLPFHTSLKLIAEADQIELWVNGKKIKSWKDSFLPGHRVGFQTSVDHVEVADYTVLNKNGEKLGGTFQIGGALLRFAPLNAALLFGIGLLLSLGLWLALFRAEGRVHLVNIFRNVSAFIALTGLLWLSFDYFYYSKLENYTLRYILPSFKSTPAQALEPYRQKIFSSWYQGLGGEPASLDAIIKTHGIDARTLQATTFQQCTDGRCESIPGHIENLPRPRFERSKRIMVLGGSIFARTRAESDDTTFTAMLQRKMPPGTLRESLNVSGPLSLTTESVREIWPLIEAYNPGYFVFTTLEPRPVEAIDLLFRMLEKKNIQIIFLVPQRNSELWDEAFRQASIHFLEDLKRPRQQLPTDYSKQWFGNHGNLQYLTNHHRLQLLNYNDILNRVPPTGQIWWDGFHLTNFGMSLLTEAFAADLTKIMSPGKENP